MITKRMAAIAFLFFAGMLVLHLNIEFFHHHLALRHVWLALGAVALGRLVWNYEKIIEEYRHEHRKRL